MIIYKPPHQVQGAPNLSKGMDVFMTVANMAIDRVIYTDIANDNIVTEMAQRLSGVHSPSYVEGVIDGTISNGYGTTDLEANLHSLHSCFILADAAATALTNPGVPIFAPVSGFHHAGYEYGSGYCTFNGLVLAASEVKAACENVLIIDGDGHWGDGTADLIKCHDLSSWLHVCELDHSSVEGQSFIAFDKLRATLELKKWDLIIYQAGADSHIDDPYCAGYLDDYQWEERDRAIFNHTKTNGIPIVFCLAGGYNGKETILLHSYTVREARIAYGEPARAHLSPLRDPQ